jgi:hypothetical protein
MRQNRLYVPEVNAARYGTRALQRARFAELDQTFTIELGRMKMSKSLLEKSKTCCLRSSDHRAGLLPNL